MAEHEPPTILAISNVVYGLLLRACPAGYRREYGAPMAQAFQDLAREAYRRHRAGGILALWLRTLPDACGTALAEHLVALIERRTAANVQLVTARAQAMSLGGGGTPMRRKIAAGLMVAALGAMAFRLLFQYQPAVVAAPGVVLHVPTQPGWLDGLVKAGQDLTDQVPSTYRILGWNADGVVYYEETDTTTKATTTWAYAPGRNARPQQAAAATDIVPTAVSPREVLLDLVRAPVWPPSAEPNTRPLHIRQDGLASPDGRWAAVVAKHIYGPEDVIVVALE